MARTRKAAAAASGAVQDGADTPGQAAPIPDPENASESVAPPTVGRVVHVNIGTDNEAMWRAGIVAEEGADGGSWVSVFLGPHDIPFSPVSRMHLQRDGSGVSAAFYPLALENHGEAPGCWRWPPRD